MEDAYDKNSKLWKTVLNLRRDLHDYLVMRCAEETVRTGKYMSLSSYIRILVEEDMKKRGH